MVDNVVANAGAGGATFATDDIGGIHYPITKVSFGALNAATLVTDAAASRLPVKVGEPVPNVTATGALNALDATVAFAADGLGLATWEIDTGSLVGTVVFEATLDDANWFAIGAMRIDGTKISSTASFPDRGAFTTLGYSQVRLRVSAFTSGTSDARLAGSAGSGNMRLVEPIPAGTANIGQVDIASLPNEGQQTKANSISVTFASDQGDFLSVTGHTRNEAFKEATAIGGELDDTAPVAATEGNVSPARITAQRALHANLRNNAGTEIGTSGAPIRTDPTGTTTQPVSAAGDTAHDAGDAGNPVKVGAVAQSGDQTAVANGDRVNLVADLNGKLVVAPYAVPEKLTRGASGAITALADTPVIAAPGAGLRLYITHLLVTNSHATVGTVVQIKDGGTMIYEGYARQDGGGFSIPLPAPLRLSVNTPLNAANLTNGSNIYVSASGYIAP